MILGFAHITKNVDKYHQSDAIPSAPAKWPLMLEPATKHCLTLGPHDSGRPCAGTVPLMVEIIGYDTGVHWHPGRLGVGSGEIVVSNRDADAEMAFFRNGLGLQALYSYGVQLRAHIPHWSIQIPFMQRADAPLDPPLDREGYAALAFYSSDVEADRDRATAAGGRTPTEPFTAKLDREMKIIMLRSPEGTIIELIQVKP